MKACARSVGIFVGGLFLLLAVFLHDRALYAADRIGIAAEITSLGKILSDAGGVLEGDVQDRDDRSVKLLEASREIRDLLNRLAIRLERAKPGAKDSTELERLARFIDAFRTYLSELEGAGQDDDLAASRHALSLMSKALAEMDQGAPARPVQLPEDATVKSDVRDEVVEAPEETPVAEKIEPRPTPPRVEPSPIPGATPHEAPDLIVSKVDVSHHLGLINPGEISVFPYVLNQSSKQVVVPIRIRVIRHEDFDCLLHGGVSSQEERRVAYPCATLPAEIPWPSMTMSFDVEVNFDNAIPESNRKNNLCRVDYRVGFAEIDTFPCNPVYRDSKPDF